VFIEKKSINILFAIGIIVYIAPQLDQAAYALLNGHLTFMPLWYKKIIAMMNHRLENYINLLLILFSFTLAVPIDSKKSKKYWLFILGSMVFYEFCYQSIVRLDHTKLFLRSSPSFHFNGIDLSIFDPNNIKIYAKSSFPSGHAMVLGYWCASTSFLFPEHMKIPCRGISFLLCLPRLIGGGHWLSDVVTGYILGNLFFEAYLSLLKKIPMRIENENKSYVQNTFC